MKFPVKIFLIVLPLYMTVVSYVYIWTFLLCLESLKGVRVLVTGASTGIGEQVAYHYARLGAQIVITARRAHALNKVAKKCQDLGAQKILYIPADMASPAEANRVVEDAEEQLEGLDYIVLNHIGPSPYRMWDGDVDHMRWLMQVNFHSYVQMTQKALPALEKSMGSIVVVSSLIGKLCSPYALPYIATKFAVNGFFGSLQHELAMKQSNVSVSVCILGFIDTDSSMEKTKPYPAREAAWQVVKAGALRQSEVFYPWYTYYCTLIRDWFPYFRDLRSVTSYRD
uniref:Hydroxysteroid 11-beta-dehydrogenase 1-like protein n=1 Tax=Electrophorus electricus TaxID=8005 RepID=A0A4W4HFM1_ELEEL